MGTGRGRVKGGKKEGGRVAADVDGHHSFSVIERRQRGFCCQIQLPSPPTLRSPYRLRMDLGIFDSPPTRANQI